MTTFTNEQRENLTAQAQEILARLSDGTSVLEIMTHIYVDNLEGKTETQGRVMAEAIIDEVRQFDADYKNAQQDLEGLIDNFQSKVDDGKTCLERCNYWLKLGAALSMLSSAEKGEKPDREFILNEVAQMNVTEEEATEMLETELREKAKEAILNSSIMLNCLHEQADAIEQIEQGDEIAGMIIDMGNNEIDFRAIMAMLAYTKIKNGEIENIPADLTIEQITALVCAGVVQAGIADSVENGNMAVDVSAVLIKILGIIVITHFALCVSIMSCLVAVVALGSGAWLFCIETIVIIGCVFYVAVKLWNKLNRPIAKLVVKGIKKIVKGIKRVAEFVKVTVIPKIKEKSAKVLRWLSDKLVGENASVVNTETTVTN